MWLLPQREIAAFNNLFLQPSCHSGVLTPKELRAVGSSGTDTSSELPFPRAHFVRSLTGRTRREALAVLLVLDIELTISMRSSTTNALLGRCQHPGTCAYHQPFDT
jgi:hypothetical protein